MIGSKIAKTAGVIFLMVMILATIVVVGKQLDASSTSFVTRVQNEAAFVATFGMQPPKDEQERAWMAPTVNRIMSELRTAHDNQNQRKENVRTDPTTTQEVRDAEVAMLNAQMLRLVRAIELAKEYNLYTRE